MRSLAVAGLCLLLAAGDRAGERPSSLRSTRALIERLRAAGRAEAVLETTVEDFLGGSPRRLRGRLALELPRWARLDFEGGESLTLREDGGEWLEPRTRQLLRSGPRSAGAALRWSAVLLASDSAEVRERALAGGGYELTPADSGATADERQRVWLGPAGLPARLEVATAGGERRTYRLSGWRFTRARGRAAFVLAAPRGVEVVDLP